MGKEQMEALLPLAGSQGTLLCIQDSEAETKAHSSHTPALGPEFRKESHQALCSPLHRGVRCRILSRARTLEGFALLLNLPFHVVLIKQLNHAGGWSTAFITGPEGSLSPDFRPAASGIEISVLSGRPLALQPLRRSSSPASSLWSPWCYESPRIANIPTAIKLTSGSHRTGRRASNRDIHEGFLRTQPSGAWLAPPVKSFPCSLWQVPLPRGWSEESSQACLPCPATEGWVSTLVFAPWEVSGAARVCRSPPPPSPLHFLHTHWSELLWFPNTGPC